MRRSNAVSAPERPELAAKRARAAPRAPGPPRRQRRGRGHGARAFDTAPPQVRAAGCRRRRRAGGTLAGVGPGVQGVTSPGSGPDSSSQSSCGEHPQGGDAVRQAVMDPDHERRAPVVDRADDVHAPERSQVVEALGHRLAREAAISSARSSTGSEASADVVADVEARRRRPRRASRGAAGWRPGAGALAVGPRGGTRPGRTSRSTVTGCPSRAGSTITSFRVWPGDRLGLEPQDAGVVGAEPLHHRVYRRSGWRGEAAPARARRPSSSSPASFAPGRSPGRWS